MLHVPPIYHPGVGHPNNIWRRIMLLCLKYRVRRAIQIHDYNELVNIAYEQVNRSGA
jgi:hypothetical protein